MRLLIGLLLAAVCAECQTLTGSIFPTLATYASDAAANAVCTTSSCEIGKFYRRSSDGALRIVCTTAGTFADFLTCIGGTGGGGLSGLTTANYIPFVSAPGTLLIDTTGGKEFYRDPSTGNIGIGISAPFRRLHVVGAANGGMYLDADNSVGVGNQLIIRGATDTASNLYIGYETAQHFASLQAVTQGTPPTYRPISLNHVGGNVAIGTAFPTISGTGRLHVTGNTARPFDAARTPATSTEACNVGEVSFNAGTLFVCSTASLWVKVPLFSFSCSGYLKSDGTCDTPSGGGGGTITGPGTSTANALVRWSGTGGNVQKDSNVSLSDSGTALVFSGAAGLTAGGTNQNITLAPTGTGVVSLGPAGNNISINGSNTGDPEVRIGHAIGSGHYADFMFGSGLNGWRGYGNDNILRAYVNGTNVLNITPTLVDIVPPTAFAANVSVHALVYINTTEPTCNSTNRGVVAMVQGAAGVADTYRICTKDAANAYAYTSMLGGGGATLETAGSNGTATANAGDDTTAARSDHQHLIPWQIGLVFEATPGTGTYAVPLPINPQCGGSISADTVVIAADTQGSAFTFNVQRLDNTFASVGNLFSSTQTYNVSGNKRQDFSTNSNNTSIAATDVLKVNFVTMTAVNNFTVTVAGKCKNK